MPLPSETPPPGVNAFAPADDTLLAFLRQKLAGEPLPAAAVAHFHDADIYAADPATLTAGYCPAQEKKGEDGSCWFFFTRVRPRSARDSRKSRLVGGGAGTWHSERAPRRVLDGDGNCVGQGQYFSYKRTVGKNCRVRSDWYMVEFSEDHGADHERVHGGEPQLVLCKIYKVHACSSSRSARGCASRQSSCKRKATDDHRADLASASAPVKAKRRLFDPPAPVPAATSADEATVVHWYNELARIIGCEETSLENLRSEGWLDRMNKSYATSDFLFGTEPAEPLRDKVSPSPCESVDTFWTPEVAALHSQVDTSSGFLMAGTAPPAVSSASWTSDSAYSTEQDPCDPTHSSWMPETQASDSSFLMIAGESPPVPAYGLSSASWILDSGFSTEQDPCDSAHSSWMPETHASDSSFLMTAGDAPPAPAHACSATLISDSAFSAEQDPRECIHSSWMPETDAPPPQVHTGSFLMTGDAPPAPAHRAPGSSSASWSSNDTTSSCSSELGWFLGAPTCADELSRAVARFTNKCSIASSHVLPQATAAPSWWCIPDIGTC